MDVSEVGQLLLDQVPLIAGTLLGAAGGLWRQISIHNSTARYGWKENEQNHQKLRQYFIGVVNGKEKMRDVSANPCASWNATILFYFICYGLAFGLVIGAGVIVSVIKDGPFVDFMTKQWLYSGEVGAAIIVYLMCWRHLKKERHDTLIFLPGDKWIRLSGLRAEDGLATKDLTKTQLKAAPGFASEIEKA